MAVEYVYALHDFVPQNDDEIDFEAGERIEVIEKDDLYGDGWWTGRNLAGRLGIFPKDYTTPAGPVVTDARTLTAAASFGTPLHSLTEENETNEAVPDNGTVMAATMTDIQAAIDQLGQHRNDDGRSMSFASTRDDRGSELGHDLDDDEDVEGEEWHRGARRRLFEGLNAVDGRHFTPPVDVEMSDESDADDDHPHLHHNHDARHVSSPPKKPNSIEEQHKDTREVLHRSPSPQPTSDHSGSTRQASTMEEASKADVPPSAAPEAAQVEVDLRSPSEPHASPVQPKEPSQGVPTPAQPNTQPTTPTAAASSIPPIPDSFSAPSIGRTPALPSVPTLNSYQTAPTLPQPSPTIPESNSGMIYPFPPTSNLISTAMSSTSSAAGSTLVLPPSSASTAPNSSPSMKRSNHPSEWTVEQVVEWVRSRGFDEGVCAKFQEHEIAGDVLLEFDVHMLKEIDIPAFGKRMRIASAIQELRRPASITSSDAASVIPNRVILPFPNPGAHSYNSSLSSAAPHSANSPLSYMQMQQQQVLYNGGEMADVPEMEPRSRADSEPGATTAGETVVPTLGHGSQTIGPGVTTKSKNRPVSLALSASDRPLQVPKVLTLTPESDIEPRSIERLTPLMGERVVLSEGEGKRRKDLVKYMGSSVFQSEFGAIPGSPASKSRLSLDRLSRPKSSQAKEKTEEEGKHRLSFFSTSIGRNRKPAPRYSSDQASESVKRPESIKTTSSGSALAGLMLSSPNLSETDRTKALTNIYYGDFRPPRPSTARAKDKEPSVLRKRTNSNPMPESPDTDGAMKRPAPMSVSAAGPSGKAGTGGTIKLKPGVNALTQLLETLGEADFSGWIMKKGERYNTWKMRFFYLKGPHMYYLRSKTETKVKGYINIHGYKVVADDTINPGRYGFRIIHDVNKPHAFASDEHAVVREWMKALMKATIDRDFTRPVISSANIPTISLTVAQAMNPAPRPPSPTQRDAVQRAMRAGAPIELSSRDARVLMGVLGDGTRSPPPPRADQFYGGVLPPAPARPSREMRRTMAAAMTHNDMRT